jgi:hypothetical protein
MRPWHLFPILTPALWAGVTFGGLWPATWPVWLNEPWMPIACMAAGLLVAVAVDLVLVDNRDVARKRRPKGNVFVEPLALVRRTLTPIARSYLPHARDLRVDMPEPMTEPPVPRR